MTVGDIVKVTQYLTRAEETPICAKVDGRFLSGVRAVCRCSWWFLNL